MNDIAKELITEINLFGEAGKPKKPQDQKPSNAKFTTGGRWYTADPKKGGEYVGRMDRGKWIDATPEEKQKEKEKHAQPVAPPTPKGKRGRKPAVQSAPTQTPKQPATRGKVNREQLLSDIDDKIDSAKKRDKQDTSNPKTNILIQLRNVLARGDAEILRDFINKHNIVIGQSRVLKVRSLVGKTQQDITSGDIELTRQIYDLSKEMGVEFSGASLDDDDTDTSSEEFKAQQIFKGRQQDQLDVTETSNGDIQIEGSTVRIIPINGPNGKLSPELQRVIDTAVELARKKLKEKDPPQELDTVYERRLRKYIIDRQRAANRSIEYLQKLAREGKKLPAFQFEGDEGKTDVVSAVDRLIDEHVPEKRRDTAKKALQKMANAKNAVEFNAAYAEFAKEVRGTPLRKNMKYIAETLTALRVLALGGVALIPTSDSFPLADVLSLQRNPLTGEAELIQILTDFDENQEVTAAGSVKVGKGAGSKNQGKIENSDFDEGTNVDGVDCSRNHPSGRSVTDDLMDMTDLSTRDAIFNTSGKVSEEVDGMIRGHISRYGPMIKAYYGLSESMTDDELYKFLSYGRGIVCLDGQPSPTPDGMDGKPFKQAEKQNGEQWRAWSVLGRITEAVHNRTVRQQFYHTHRYNGIIKTADGIRVFSKMEFQPFKKETTWKGGGQFTRPDQAQNAFTIPSTPENMRNGNPCTQ